MRGVDLHPLAMKAAAQHKANAAAEGRSVCLWVIPQVYPPLGDCYLGGAIASQANFASR